MKNNVSNCHWKYGFISFLFLLIFFVYSCSGEGGKPSNSSAFTIELPVQKKSFSSRNYSDSLSKYYAPLYFYVKIIVNNDENNVLDLLDSQGNLLNSNGKGAVINLVDYYSGTSSNISIQAQYKGEINSLKMEGRYLAVELNQSPQDWCKNTKDNSISNLNGKGVNLFYSDLNITSTVDCSSSNVCSSNFSLPNVSPLKLDHVGFVVNGGANKAVTILDAESDTEIVNPCTGAKFTANIDSNNRLTADLPIVLSSKNKLKVKVGDKKFALDIPSSYTKPTSTCSKAENSDGLPVFWKLDLAGNTALPLDPTAKDTDNIYLNASDSQDGSHSICERIANNFNPRFKDYSSTYISPLDSYSHIPVVSPDYTLNAEMKTGLQLIDVSDKNIFPTMTSQDSFLAIQNIKIMCKIKDINNNYILGSLTTYADCTDKILDPANLNALFISNNIKKMNISYYYADSDEYNLYTSSRSLSNSQNPSAENPITLTYSFEKYPLLNGQYFFDSVAVTDGVYNPTYYAAYNKIDTDADGYIQPGVSSNVQIVYYGYQTAEYYTILGTDITSVGGNSSDITQTNLLQQIEKWNALQQTSNWSEAMSSGDLSETYSVLKDYFNAHKSDLFIGSSGTQLTSPITIPFYTTPDRYPIVSTLAGTPGSSGYVDATGVAAKFGANLTSPAIDHNGNLYIADNANNVIRKITPSGEVTTFMSAFGKNPRNLKFNKDESLIYVPNNNTNINIINMATKTFNTSIGHNVKVYAPDCNTPNCINDPSINFNMPSSIVFDEFNNIFLTESGSHLVREITYDGQLITIAGTPNTSGFSDSPPVLFSNPVSITMDSQHNLYVGEIGNQKIRKITLNYNGNHIASGGEVTTFAGSGAYSYSDGTGTAAQFRNPIDFTVDTLDNIYVADRNNGLIRKITPAGVVTTIAGTYNTNGFADNNVNGTALAIFNIMDGITINKTTNTLYISDSYNYAIRQVDITKNTQLTQNFGFVQPVNIQGSTPCGPEATSCSNTTNNFGITSNYKTFQNYKVPTLIPVTGLNYYILLVHVDLNGTPSFQLINAKIPRL